MTPTKKKAEKLPVIIYGELLGIVDNFLAGVSGRSLIDSGEVQDFCLDLRLILSPLLQKDDKNTII